MPSAKRMPHARHLRLANQRLVGRGWRTPADAVRFMTAMQAQDYAGALWSVGLRVSGCTQADVEGAIASRTIVRSWPMRGTLHLVAAEDLGWILSLTTERLIAGAAKRRANLGLDLPTLERARGVVVRALEGGRQLSRSALLTAIERGGVSTAGQRGYHVLWFLSQTGTLCFGRREGKEQAFVLSSEWIRKSRRLDRDEALGELVRRYFASHGPATRKDVVAWTKLTAGDVSTGLAIARPDLATLEADGETYFMAADAEAVLADVREEADGVRLLPGFDEYVLGYRDRGAVLAPEHADAIVPGGNGVFRPTVVASGRVVGTWRAKARARKTVVETVLFEGTKLARRDVRAIEEQVARYGAFLGVACELAMDRA